MKRSALARWLTELALRRPVAVLAWGLVVCVVGVVLATRLSIATDLAELLPPKAPSVVALRALSQRVGGTGNVNVAIESIDGTPAPLRAYVPMLAAELQKQLGDQLLAVRFTRKDVEAFYKKFAAYYVPLDDLKKWQGELATAIAKQNPAYVELDDHAPDPVKQLADDIRAKEKDLHAPGGYPEQNDPETGLRMAENGRLSVVFVRPAANSLDLAGSNGVLDKIQQIVASTHPEQHGHMDLQDFRAVLVRLPDDQREALVLVGAAGFSYEEAAEICNCAVGTIKSRVNRARNRIAEMLGMAEQESGEDDIGLTKSA